MSSYVFGTKISYGEYLQTKSFVSDVTSATRQVSMDISRQTREVIASNEALSRDNIRAMEESADRISGAMSDGFGQVADTLNAGFDRLSYGLDNISDGITQLNSTFHWGFGQMLGSMGHMNDTLSELVKIAKTPVQTVAFNHFEIARDAFRQGLYQESFEELEKAIAGDHTSAGYKLEWRFHQLKGVLRLGFADGDMSIFDLAKAEEAFLLAARYGKTDYPEDAGRAFLSAGWAAYCQGNMKQALEYTEQAMALHPRMGEAFFQAAKIQMALGNVDAALPVLGKAVDLDRFYALKAAGDGDFQPHDERLRSFLEALRKEKYRQSVPKVEAALKKIKFWLEHVSEAKNNKAVKRMQIFLKEGGTWPLLDMLNVVQNLEKTIGEIETGAKNSTILVSTETADGAERTREETYQVEETYQEKVVIEPGGFFKKAVTEMRTKTRMVTKKRVVNYNLAGVMDSIYQGFGKLITSIEFCPVSAGRFMMGDSSKHQVTISKDFLIGKYPVTQALWQTIMGNNPSHFKGADRSVEIVSWDDCQVFIQKLNSMSGKNIYRLPTEAEWEYACRAGSSAAYCFGDDESRLGEYAWYNANSGNETHPVGQKKPNSLGLYDMHGNVWEWCHDWYGEYPSGSVTDPKGPSSGSDRVIRGGSWLNYASLARVADRNLDNPVDRVDLNGFRLVRTC